MQTTQSNLQQWCIWFFIGNVFLFWLIGTPYLTNISWIDSSHLNRHGVAVVLAFAALAYVGLLGLLALLPCFILIPVIAVFPKRNGIFALAIMIATCSAVLLVIDTVIYKLYHYHLNGVVLNLIIHGVGTEILGLSAREYGWAVGIIAGLLFVEWCYALWLWKRILRQRPSFVYVMAIIAVLSISLYFSYLMIVSSAKYSMSRVLIDSSRFLPLYSEGLNLLMWFKDSQITIDRLAELNLIQPKKAKAQLHYPLKPLQCAAAKRPMNLVIIVIDAWRYDMLNKKITPNLMEFAEKSLVFKHHFSGGNATGPGIFSLFYGMPVSYWTAMEDKSQRPVLIDELLKRHYQLGVFSSAPLELPPFSKTVFANIKNIPLRTPGATPYRRDLNVTKEFKQFIAKAAKQPQPFFSFVFYDGVHSYCAYDENSSPYKPVIKDCNRMMLTSKTDPLPYLNRYKNSVLLVDKQVKQVIDTLKKEGVLNNTIVVVTGDHGEEFNEDHSGYWGHASHFTRYQIQTPLIVYWPGKKPRQFQHVTSHYDIVPTLMAQLFNCRALAANYSVGTFLFDPAPRPYLIIGSYIDLGVLEKDQITTIFPTGNFRIEQPNGKVLTEAKLDISAMYKVFLDMRRFYQQ